MFKDSFDFFFKILRNFTTTKTWRLAVQRVAAAGLDRVTLMVHHSEIEVNKFMRSCS